MTENRTGEALRIALAYHQAWTGKDFELAMTYIADDIVCDAPAGRIAGAAAYREFMGPFVQILLSSRLIAAFGDDEQAVVVYDTETVPVKSGPVDGSSAASRPAVSVAPTVDVRPSTM